MRAITKKLILASLLLATALLTIGSAYAAPLYFPHVDTNLPWQTEIAIINTGNQTVTGTLQAFSNAGQLVGTKAVTLSPRGRTQLTVAAEFTNPTAIGYIIFATGFDTVQGYTKFYQAGIYRAAIPAVKEVNTSNIYISHIDSGTIWWTGISLVNTTSIAKNLTITFNNGQSRQISLSAKQHTSFTIASLFNNQPQPDIQSAVITNASDIVGLELFGNISGSNHLDGILLTDKTVSTIYYPHVAGDGWWTGIVAYNPSASACTITIAPYSAQGDSLSPSTLSIAGKGKYVGLVSGLGLPAQTAWFRIDSTLPLSGFELFGTTDDNQLAAYAGGGGTGAKAGIFAKIEKNGWTGIAFVNTEASAASVTLTAYNDAGTALAAQVLPLGGHAKVVNFAEAIFSQSISSATYITYSSDRNVVGFQLNGSADGMMLDGLPALAGTDTGSGTTPPTYTLSGEQAVMKNSNGNPDYITIAIDMNTGRREEVWVYTKLKKRYIFWDGKRVNEGTVTVADGAYSKPPNIDPALFTNITTQAHIKQLFGTNYTVVDQSAGALSFLTWYYQSAGLSVSFSGGNLVVVQTIDKP